MGDNTNYLFSFVFNKTENEMYIKIIMSFYSENSFKFNLLLLYVTRILLLVSSGCLTGSWSVWSHAVTPHSTIYHLVFVI